MVVNMKDAPACAMTDIDEAHQLRNHFRHNVMREFQRIHIGKPMLAFTIMLAELDKYRTNSKYYEYLAKPYASVVSMYWKMAVDRLVVELEERMVSDVDVKKRVDMLLARLGKVPPTTPDSKFELAVYGLYGIECIECIECIDVVNSRIRMSELRDSMRVCTIQ